METLTKHCGCGAIIYYNDFFESICNECEARMEEGRAEWEWQQDYEREPALAKFYHWVEPRRVQPYIGPEDFPF